MFGTLPTHLLTLTPEELGVNLCCLQVHDEFVAEQSRALKGNLQFCREVG